MEVCGSKDEEQNYNKSIVAKDVQVELTSHSVPVAIQVYKQASNNLSAEFGCNILLLSEPTHLEK